MIEMNQWIFIIRQILSEKPVLQTQATIGWMSDYVFFYRDNTITLSLPLSSSLLVSPFSDGAASNTSRRTAVLCMLSTVVVTLLITSDTNCNWKPMRRCGIHTQGICRAIFHCFYSAIQHQNLEICIQGHTGTSVFKCVWQTFVWWRGKPNQCYVFEVKGDGPLSPDDIASTAFSIMENQSKPKNIDDHKKRMYLLQRHKAFTNRPIHMKNKSDRLFSSNSNSEFLLWGCT